MEFKELVFYDKEFLEGMTKEEYNQHYKKYMPKVLEDWDKVDPKYHKLPQEEK